MKNLHISLHRNVKESNTKFRLIAYIKKIFYPALFGAIIGCCTTNLYLFIIKESFVTHVVLTISVGIALGSFAGVFLVKMLEDKFRIRDILSIIVAVLFSLISAATMLIFLGK